MKRYITEKAILSVIELYRYQRDLMRDSIGKPYDLALSRQIGIIDCFADMTGQNWIAAETMLRRRAEATDPKEPK